MAGAAPVTRDRATWPLPAWGLLGGFLGASEGGSGHAGFSFGVHRFRGLASLRGAFLWRLAVCAGGGGFGGVLAGGRNLRGASGATEGGEDLGFRRGHVG